MLLSGEEEASTTTSPWSPASAPELEVFFDLAPVEADSLWDSTTHLVSNKSVGACSYEQTWPLMSALTSGQPARHRLCCTRGRARHSPSRSRLRCSTSSHARWPSAYVELTPGTGQRIARGAGEVVQPSSNQCFISKDELETGSPWRAGCFVFFQITPWRRV
jgi:hypothetical protein